MCLPKNHPLSHANSRDRPKAHSQYRFHPQSPPYLRKWPAMSNSDLPLHHQRPLLKSLRVSRLCNLIEITGPILLPNRHQDHELHDTTQHHRFQRKLECEAPTKPLPKPSATDGTNQTHHKIRRTAISHLYCRQARLLSFMGHLRMHLLCSTHACRL